MLPVLKLGPLAIQTPGLIWIAGLWLGLSWSEKFAPRRGVLPDTLYNLVFTTLISAVLGARLAVVLRYPGAFFSNPISLVSPNPQLLDLSGGLAAALIAALIYAQRKQMSFWPSLDALAPLLSILVIAKALADLAAGSAFGTPSGVPWAIELWGASRHPTQGYAALAASLTAWWVRPSGRLACAARPAGMVFLAFLSLTTAAALFIEGFRGDSQVLLAGLRTTQIIAWLILAAALWGIHKRQKNPPFDPSS